MNVSAAQALRTSMTSIPTHRVMTTALRKEVRLLVVDDHGEHFEQLREIAEMYHPEFRVECKLASNAVEAVCLASSWRASVVLLDLHVISSALDLVKQLATQGTAVVATSDTRLPELAETASEYGAVGYLSKSDNPDDIEALLAFVAGVSVEGTPQQ